MHWHRDVVDTEPSNGNVWKMLLGAVNEWFDDDASKTHLGAHSPLRPVSVTVNGAANHQYRASS